jgi:CheY-like chemotaxis protein
MSQVVIADDDDMSRLLLEMILTRVGHDVRSAKTGNDVLQLVRQTHPALVIADQHMPKLGGVAVCQHIKRSPDLAAVRVILSTSSLVRDGGAALQLESGADGVIIKLWVRMEIEQLVARLLQDG